MGGKSTTSTTTTKPPKEVMQAYNDLLAQAKPISQTAYQPYTGGANGSGFEQNQLTGFQNIANLAGSQDANFGAAANALQQSAIPTSQAVGQYMSPYLQNVVQSTMANMNEQNAEQQQGVLGNAAAQGALGGNRVGVAQAELARQQNLANQSTIANLYNTGYNNALGAAQAQQQAYQNAAAGYTNLGQTAMNSALQQAVSQVGAGTQQQQFNYQQYQNQLSYPFETTSWLANIVEGLGAGMGGTTSQTQPAGNTGSSILGGLLGLGSLFLLNEGGRVPEYAQGGVIPYSRPSGVVPMAGANDNGMSGANDNMGYVPQAATGTDAHSTMPQAVAQPAQGGGDQGLNQGISQMEKAIQQKYPNGILAGLNSPALPQTAPIPTPNPMTNSPAATASVAPVGGSAAPQNAGGLMAALGHLFGGGFADGGATPPHVVGLMNDKPEGGGAGQTQRRMIEQQQQKAASNQPPGSGAVVSSAFGAMPYAANGGVIRGYDVGGGVDDYDPLHDPVILPFEKDADFNTLSPGQATNAGSTDMTPIIRKNVDVAPFLNAPKDVKDYPVAGVAPADDAGVSTVAPGEKEVYPGANGVATNGLPIAGVVPPAVAAVDREANGRKFSKINSQYGLPDNFLDRMSYVESGGNPKAYNADSGAAGEFQFVPSTARQYNLKNPYDADASADAAARLASDNRTYLEGGLKRAPTGGELYLAHQQGANGALNLLTHPDALATDIVGRAAVVQNGGNTRMTAGQFAQMWINKFDGAPTSPASQDSGVAASSPSGVASVPDDGKTIAAGSMPAANTGVVPNPGEQPSEGGSGVLSDILHGKRPHLSDDVRLALLSAGLGMMASKSPNIGTAIGEGGLQGVQTYMARKQFGLENQKIEQAGQELALRAKEVASGIAQNTANTLKTGVETQAIRYPTIPTAVGPMVRDVMNPQQAPQFVTGTGGPSSRPPAVASPAQEAASNIQPPPTQEQAPSPDISAERFFTTKAPTDIPLFDRRLMQPPGSPGPQLALGEAKQANQSAREESLGASSSRTQLAEMQHDLDTLPDNGLLSAGAGFKKRGQLASAIHTGFTSLGIDDPLINENELAAAQDLNKLTTRLGFDLSKTLGSREAATVVQNAIDAVPGGANSKEGAKRIIAGIQASNQRKIDYYNFLQDWENSHYGSVLGADEAFNRLNPPEKYATWGLLQIAKVPKTQTDIDGAKKGDLFNVDGNLLVKQ